MTAPVFNLAAAKANTPNWPPYDGDVWADRDGTRWAAYINDIGNDEAVLGFQALDSARRSILPDYLLEIAGPLELVQAGWQRTRYTQAAAA